MRFLSAAVVTVAAVFSLAAADVSAAESMNQLLQQTENVGKARAQEEASLAADFNNATPEDQKKMLKQALDDVDAAKAQQKSLSEESSANELQVNKLTDQLHEQAKSLGVNEIFGLAKQVAGDLSTTLDQSMITAQFAPGSPERSRADFLSSFSSEKSMPTTAQLERFWKEIQLEMVEDAKVLRFKANVIQPDGNSEPATVVRIGPFIAMSEGKYLSYKPDLKSLIMLPRQPPSKFLAAARRLENAKSGYVPAVVDSTRGVLLSLYVQRPTWFERINQGEAVDYVIIAVFLIGAVAFIFQLFYLIFMRLGVGWQLSHLDTPKKNNPLGRVLLAFKGDPNTIEDDADIAELRISEAVLHEVPKLERFQSLLRLAVAAGPLLGLIGTVVGMIITFQSIVEAGTGDPRLMAHGIGTAMIATVLGLACAIPLLFANAGLASLSRTMIQILDEQSAGLLAESLERRRNA